MKDLTIFLSANLTENFKVYENVADSLGTNPLNIEKDF